MPKKKGKISLDNLDSLKTFVDYLKKVCKSIPRIPKSELVCNRKVVSGFRCVSCEKLQINDSGKLIPPLKLFNIQLI